MILVRKILSLALVSLVGITFYLPNSILAHTPINYSSKYSYNADSNYYTDHFKAYINVFGVNSVAWESNHVDGTLTFDNQNGDLWRMYYHSMYSGGYKNYESSIHSSHSHTGANSSYNESIYYTKYITKGDNYIDFYFKYDMKNTSGQIVETHYLKRSRSNF